MSADDSAPQQPGKIVPLREPPIVEVHGDELPLLKPGKYDLAFEGWQTRVYFRRSPKVALWFHIVDQGSNFGIRVPRYYNATRLKGRLGKNGAFVVAGNSDFAREYARLFNAKIPRRDRRPMARFEKHIIVGRIRTVEHDSLGRRIPEPIRYSVVAELIRVKSL